MRRSSKIAAGVVIAVALGWGLWELTKWGLAIAGAPETAGLSLVAAAALP